MKYRGVEAPPAYNRTGSPPNTQFLSLGFSHPSICSAVVCTYFWKSSKWSPVDQTHVVKRSTVVMILKFILYLFQNSPLYQYLQDLGHTDFEVCSSLSPKAEKSAVTEGQQKPPARALPKVRRRLHSLWLSLLSFTDYLNCLYPYPYQKTPYWHLHVLPLHWLRL